MDNDKIEKLVIELSHDPFNSEKNFAVAVEYEKLGQTASAVSFYLRAAEYCPERYDPIAYASLLRLAHCFETQKDRVSTVSNCILQAIAYDPRRPEGYFLMARFHERAGNWQECYSYAEIGLACEAFDPLPVWVDYHGRYCLDFEKAISGWWIGRRSESIWILNVIASMDGVSEEYKEAARYNLERLGVASS